MCSRYVDKCSYAYAGSYISTKNPLSGPNLENMYTFLTTINAREFFFYDVNENRR